MIIYMTCLKMILLILNKFKIKLIKYISFQLVLCIILELIENFYKNFYTKFDKIFLLFYVTI